MRDGGVLRLSAVNRAAARLGLSPGLPLADARAPHPDLALAEADPVADARFLENMADWCQRFTPLVALAPPDAVLLDVTGATHLFGGEAGLARAIEAAFRRRGLALRAAIAGFAALALALARFGAQAETVRILPPAEIATAAGALPAVALGLDSDGLRLLRRLGLDTVAAVEAQPREALLARLGRPALDALDRLHGRSKPPFTSRHIPPSCLAERAFAEPVASEPVVLATLARLMEDVAALLERRGEGARRVRAVFFRADGAVRQLEVATAGAIRDPAMIERLFRERLKALADPLDPGFGFDLIRLEATETAPFDADERGISGLDAGAQREAKAEA
ncbi:MAG: Y-family DNA polymerase, partial [Beijerinckiaceae bacterium]